MSPREQADEAIERARRWVRGIMCRSEIVWREGPVFRRTILDEGYSRPYYGRMAKHILAGGGIALVVLGMVLPAGGANLYLIGAGACVIGAAHFA